MAVTSIPLWQDVRLPRFAAAALPATTDVLVIGGGITGLTAALLLKRAGRRVVLCERRRIGSGETGHTSAHLTHVTDLRLTELVKRFGRESAARIWRGGKLAIDLVESNVDSLGIECGFARVPGFVLAAIDGRTDESDSLRGEADAAASLGFAASFIERGPVLSRPAVMYADQALFHPLAYLGALAGAVHGDGCIVSEESEVRDISDDPPSAEINGSRLRFDHLVIATHMPMTGLSSVLPAALIQTKLYPYSSYIVGARVPPGGLASGLYSDTADPYNYLRISESPDGRYAILGGADHKTGTVGDPEERYRMMERTLHRMLPEATIDRRWSGQVIETNDGLPFIGLTADRQFISTGYAGNGLTFGTLGGMMARDAVLDERNPWQELLDPGRTKIVGGLGTLVRESLDYPYHLVLDRLREDRASAPESVTAGDGKVIRRGGRHVACHRTAQGELLMVSAVCTHMGCLVRFNNAEQTWDCPCHGSRFAVDGKVIGGPAEEPLERLN
jgi:glycine/D-amino acid oxidase-like deaminating enzyme/nitrite reductase/ring-hydroxylating ferredoxin subunit